MARNGGKPKAKGNRLPVLRSLGVMRNASRSVRAATFAVLALSCVALTFTQLGFASANLPGEFATAYIVVLLQPIALSALLLGTLSGVCMGLIAGGVLLGHAVAMPLDYYEMTYVTPLTSVVMLGVCGFLLGLLFAFALRHSPSPMKRVVYIVIVCVVVSFLYSIGFVVNVIATLTVELVVEFSNASYAIDSAQATESAKTSIYMMAIRMGSANTQALIDAVIMSAFCIVADVVARKVFDSGRKLGLRGVFAARMAVVVIVAFMLSTSAGFVTITQDKIADVYRSMKGQVDYLCTQISDANKRGNAILKFLEEENVDYLALDEKSFDRLIESLSVDTLLDGYTKEDNGTVLVLYADFEMTDDDEVVESGDYYIAMSDDEDFPKEKLLNEIVDDEFEEAIRLSIEKDELRRVAYDDVDGKSINELMEQDAIIHSEIVYLYAEKVDNCVVLMMQPANMVFAERSSVMMWTTLSAFILLAAVFIMVFQLLSRVVVRRIDETNCVLGQITDGNLDARVDVRDTREFESLSGGINTTVNTLKGWIAEAETRMDAELATAKAIQESALPRTFPPFPDILRFDVYASMKPAREVGGDFYDFFLIGDACNAQEGKLGFVVADVSGKGVPAALFMMKAMTQIRDYLQSGMEVGEAIENANRQLCDGNDAGMFVTAWVGVLNYQTGCVDFVNAGHNPPLLWQSEGGWRWITEKSGLPLGLFDGFSYEAFHLECAIGDEFLLYTDGVTEAMSEDGELYGEERLKALADANYTLHPRRLISAVRRDVALHAQGVEQSDDITILSLEVGVPPELTATITVPADVSELPRVNEFIHTELDRRLCPKRTQNQLDIAVEELFVNVAHYAYPDATPENPGTARISYTYSADPPSVNVSIADNGIPYNPLAKPDTVTPDDIMEVPIGGLGILIAKRSVDDMTYERLGDTNIVTIMKRW